MEGSLLIFWRVAWARLSGRGSHVHSPVSQSDSNCAQKKSKSACGIVPSRSLRWRGRSSRRAVLRRGRLALFRSPARPRRTSRCRRRRGRSSPVAHVGDDFRGVLAAVSLVHDGLISRQELAREEGVRGFCDGERDDLGDGLAVVGEDDGLLLGGFAHPECGVLVQFADGNGSHGYECGTAEMPGQDLGAARAKTLRAVPEKYQASIPFPERIITAIRVAVQA